MKSNTLIAGAVLESDQALVAQARVRALGRIYRRMGEIYDSPQAARAAEGSAPYGNRSGRSRSGQGRSKNKSLKKSGGRVTSSPDTTGASLAARPPSKN